MTFSELMTSVMAIEQDAALYEEKNFGARIEAIDGLDYQLMDRIEELLAAGGDRASLLALGARVKAVRGRLDGINRLLFARLRTEMLIGRNFREIVVAYCEIGVTEEIGYDTLDIFVNRLLAFDSIPKLTVTLEPEMVYFQKTPARIVFELVEKAGFSPADVFFDLGSGLGQVVMLVHLLAGVKCIGIEIEPAFCAYARERAGELGLSEVAFLPVDARHADYSRGTVFFLYTPFVGGLLGEVLALLRREALSRAIKVITYGPCVADVILQDWLEPEDATRGADPYRVMVFSKKTTILV